MLRRGDPFALEVAGCGCQLYLGLLGWRGIYMSRDKI